MGSSPTGRSTLIMTIMQFIGATVNVLMYAAGVVMATAGILGLIAFLAAIIL